MRIAGFCSFRLVLITIMAFHSKKSWLIFYVSVCSHGTRMCRRQLSEPFFSCSFCVATLKLISATCSFHPKGLKMRKRFGQPTFKHITHDGYGYSAGEKPGSLSQDIIPPPTGNAVISPFHKGRQSFTHNPCRFNK